jgi:hypothetical protein
MRKLFFVLEICFFMRPSTTAFAQNYLAFNSENVRTSVDGAASDYFSLKKKRGNSVEIRQSGGGVLFAALDGESTYFYGFNYSFAYPLKEIGNGGLYIAVNPSIGGVIEANSRDGGGFIFGYDIPVMAEMHFGEPDAFGAILGLGVAYNFINSSNQAIPHKAFGPIAEAGLRFNISERTYIVKATFELNLSKTKIGTAPNVYSTGDVLGITVSTVF